MYYIFITKEVSTLKNVENNLIIPTHLNPPTLPKEPIYFKPLWHKRRYIIWLIANSLIGIFIFAKISLDIGIYLVGIICISTYLYVETIFLYLIKRSKKNCRIFQSYNQKCQTLQKQYKDKVDYFTNQIRNKEFTLLSWDIRRLGQDNEKYYMIDWIFLGENSRKDIIPANLVEHLIAGKSYIKLPAYHYNEKGKMQLGYPIQLFSPSIITSLNISSEIIKTIQSLD